MRRVLVLGILTALAAVVLAADSGDTIPADDGAIQVTPVMRSSVQIESKRRRSLCAYKHAVHNDASRGRGVCDGASAENRVSIPLRGAAEG